ncbi:hypothetical protein K439DRAFT_959180 [Ramaria rubella]|nr:hypothetical protein K439DRAFT_959180 [Ramaria rubella]
MLAIPDAVRKKFAANRGWVEHIPLTCLTDAYCLRAVTDTKTQGDGWAFDNFTGSFMAVSKPLPFKGELNLSFTEWHQSWQQLLVLIKEFRPSDFAAWSSHFTHIRNKDGSSAQWELIVAYDTTVCRRSCTQGLDLAEFQMAIWNDLEPAYIVKRAQISLTNLLCHDHSYRPSYLPKREYSLDRGPHSFKRIHPDPGVNTDSFRNNTHCFICGDCGDTKHSPQGCSSPTLINGKLAHLCRTNGKLLDTRGLTYCFTYNGAKGCPSREPCRLGTH